MEETIPPDDADLRDIENKQAILAAIIDSSADAIISITLEGFITSWNRGAERMFGYEEAEVIGKHISLLIPPEKLGEEDMILNQIRNGLEVKHFDTIRVTRSGKTIPISLTVSPIRGRDGRIIGASKIARDITDQLRSQEELRTHAHIQELLLSAGRLLSENLDLQSILQKVTDITTQLTGAEFGAFFYNMVDDEGESYLLYTLSGVSRDAFKDFPMPRNTDVFEMTFSGKGILRSDDIRQDPRYGKNAPHYGMPRGHLPVVSYLAVPVNSPSSGTTIGGLFFGHSEPARFKLEQEKLVDGIAGQAGVAIENAKLYEEIKRLNLKKDEFIGVAGHELRTPITTIKAYLQLLKDETPEGAARQFTEKALRQVNKLNRLLTDLLDASKIHAGQLEYNLMPCFLLPLVRESLETIRQIHPTHPLETDLPEEDIVITADGTKIEQVLINFMTNAVKYSPEGSPIELSVKKTAGKVTVGVRDWGIGIGDKHFDLVFHRYYRVQSIEHAIGGLGIGLYIAKQIIERHGGEIGVDSQEGKGSLFYFSLPLPE
jgi:PAS domain S-box-containing protein